MDTIEITDLVPTNGSAELTRKPTFNPLSEEGLEIAMRLAERLAESGFFPRASKPAQALAIILAGQEMGMGPMTSLRSLDNIDGRIGLKPNVMLERFKGRGGRAKWLHSDGKKATLHARAANGDEHTETVTIEDAQRAGLSGKDNWKKYPTSMLRARAIAFCLRALGESEGMHTPDELGGVTDAEGAVYEPPPAKEAHPFPKERTVGKKAALAATLATPGDDTGERADEHGVIEQYIKVTKAQLASIHIYRDALRTAGYLPKEKADWEARLMKRYKRTSSADLSKAEASDLIDTLTALSRYHNEQANRKADRQATRLENMQAEEVANLDHATGAVSSPENTNEGETDGTTP